MYLVFDCGGTHLRVAVSEDGSNILRHKTIMTPPTPAEGLAAIVSLALELKDTDEIHVVSGGIAGLFNADHTALRWSPNLMKWVDYPLAHELSKAFQSPVTLNNDAALGALGESTLGAGHGVNIMAYITIGTGIGGARVINGQLDASTTGFEPGQHYINPHHTWEKEVKEIETEKKATAVAIGLNTVMSFWSPEVIVLGGGQIIHNRIALDEIAKALAHITVLPPPLPSLKKAALGDNSGLHGALLVLQSRNESLV